MMNEGKVGYIHAHALLGEWKEWSPEKKIEKVTYLLVRKTGQQVFTSGWALKENEKTHHPGPIKRISQQVKHLLETIFHTGTANPHQKLNAQQMHETCRTR
ncbi:hypothetical protein RhiirA4_465303 [Rhizophagus irregularis]|uniref:Uncharacterized protein n=1 Tax=Rhizophagus irregularis TaxID=588596 RepID=A0A2I1GRT9_9GLOM|nr:hypothetical protein RhiirA4_465303 [Rhizophagus irregularis]